MLKSKPTQKITFINNKNTSFSLTSSFINSNNININSNNSNYNYPYTQNGIF